MGRMKKKEAIAIIEAELRRQAQAGQVSSKLVEQLVTIRGWSGKAKAARAKARAGKTIVQPAEVPLPDLIKEAREQLEEASQPSPQPALGPVLPPHSPGAAASPVQDEPTQLQKWTLDAIAGLTSEPPRSSP